MLCHGSLVLTVVVGLVSSFSPPFGFGKIAENLPIPLPPKPEVETPSISMGILDKLGLTGLLRFLGLLSPMPTPGLNSIMEAKSSFSNFGIPGRSQNEPQNGNSWMSNPQAGAPAMGGSPKDLQDLNHRISRLEAVLKLQGIIQLAGQKMMATNGKEEDFATSNSTCSEVGGRIVTPMNEAENKAALEFGKKANRYTYLGIIEGPAPGTFNYLNGGPAVYTNWRKGEPSGKGIESCVEMYTDGQWNDKACNQKRLTVCEL